MKRRLPSARDQPGRSRGKPRAHCYRDPSSPPECWRADDIHPVWKVCGFRRDEGLGENAVTRPIPHGLPVDAAPSRRSMRRCSMTIILFSRGREKVWLESAFYFDEWFSSLFFSFFFLTILQADEIALRFNCVIFEFRLSPEFILFGSI